MGPGCGSRKTRIIQSHRIPGFQTAPDDPVRIGGSKISQVWLAALDPYNLPTGPAALAQGSEYRSIFTPNAAGGWDSDIALAAVEPHIGVFKVYHQFAQFAPDADLQNLARWAKAHSIKLALETPVIFSDTAAPPEGFISSADFSAMLARLKSNNVDLSYVAMDEPLLEGKTASTVIPRATGGTTAEQVAHAVAVIRQYFPDTKIGDIEAIPSLNAAEVSQWITDYGNATNSPLDFFHFDVDWNQNGYIPELLTAVGMLQARGISYGMIFNGSATDTSNLAWTADAISHYTQIDAIQKLQPDAAVIQSWNAYPTRVLPDTTPGTLTSVLAAYLQPPGPPKIGVATGKISVPDRWLPGSGGTAGSTVAVMDGTNQVGMALVQADGSWNARLTLNADTTHTLTAVATSAAGIQGAPSAPVVLTVVAAPQPPSSTGGADQSSTALWNVNSLTNPAGRGVDQVNLAFRLTQAALSRTQAGTLVITGPDGTAQTIDPAATLIAFTDGAVLPHGGTDPLVDPLYYYVHNPVAWIAHTDAVQDFMDTGWKAGRNPNAWFDTAYYLSQNPDVAQSGTNPLLHYESNGWKEGRDPSPLFSTRKYLAAHPDVASAGIDPLLQFVTAGITQGSRAVLSGPQHTEDVLIDTAYYARQLGVTLDPADATAAAQAAASYHAYGWKAGLNPNPWFDGQYYLAQNPDVASSGADPLAHYEEYGWKEGRNPSALFNTRQYLAANKDVADAQYDPLQHYLSNGINEGRPLAPFTGGKSLELGLLNNVIANSQHELAPAVPTSTGGRTNSSRQVLSGTASDPGATITILEGGVVRGTAVVGADSRWSAAVVLNGNGAHTFTVAETTVTTNLTLPGVLSTALLDLATARLPQDVEVKGAASIGSCTGFFGTDSHTMFFRGTNTQLSAVAYDDAGSVVGRQSFTHGDTIAAVEDSSTVIGGGGDFYGVGGRAIFFRNVNGLLAVWNINGSGAYDQADYLKAGGNYIPVGASATVVGAGYDVFGPGVHTVFLRGDNGELTALGFNASAAQTASRAFTVAGAGATIAAGTTVVGYGEDFFGTGGHTIFMRDSGGALTARDSTDTGALGAAVPLTSQGQPIVVGTSTTVIGAGETVLGATTRTVFLRDAHGQLTALMFDNTGAAHPPSLRLSVDASGNPQATITTSTAPDGPGVSGLQYILDPNAPTTPDPLVDVAYLNAHYPEIASSGLDATAWFHTVGWQKGANPNALFDTSYYLRQNPDVAATGMDPLVQYEAQGWLEGRAPSLLFSPGKYLAAYPDLAGALDPLTQYLQHGQHDGRMAFLPGGSGAADLLVDAAFYAAQLGATLLPTGTAAQAQAADAYANGGWQRGLNPDAWFDDAYYLSQNPDIAQAGINPLAHYETYGWHEGRNPSAAFSTNAYLAHNPDVVGAKLDPLLHYVQYGHAEGRAIYPV